MYCRTSSQRGAWKTPGGRRRGRRKLNGLLCIYACLTYAYNAPTTLLCILMATECRHMKEGMELWARSKQTAQALAIVRNNTPSVPRGGTRKMSYETNKMVFSTSCYSTFVQSKIVCANSTRSTLLDWRASILLTAFDRDGDLPSWRRCLRVLLRDAAGSRAGGSDGLRS